MKNKITEEIINNNGVSEHDYATAYSEDNSNDAEYYRNNQEAQNIDDGVYTSYEDNIDGIWGYYDSTTDTTPPIPDITTTIPTLHPENCTCEECFKKWAEENPDQYRYLVWLYCFGGATARPGEQGVPVTSEYIDNQTIYSVSAKRGASGKYNSEHINLFTGQLAYRHNDIATSGALSNAAVTHYYSSYRSLDSVDNHYGKGWRLSIQQSVRASEYEYCDYVYVDAMGKQHYFVETENHGIIDASGRKLTLTRYHSSECCITDRSGNKMTFDAEGRLVKVSDSNENTIEYTYTDGLITKVTDSFGKELTFIYDDNNMLSEIRDPKLRSVKFSYNSEGELIAITELDGEIITYAYDSKGHLIETVTPDGVKTVYTYEVNSSRVVRTDKYATFKKTSHGIRTEADIAEEGEFTIFEYRGNASTAVTDRSGIKHVYVFDKYGRCMHEYEDSLVNGTQEKGQVTGTVVHSYANQKRVFESSIVATDAENPSILVNSTFESDLPGAAVPEGWEKVGGSYNDCVTETACIDGTHSFMFANYTYGSKYLSQEVHITNVANGSSTASENFIKYGDTLILSAWAKAEAISSEDPTTKLELRATAHYALGVTEEFSTQYDLGFDGWQYAALPIRVKRNMKLESVTVYLDCSNNSGTVYFDNVRLVNSLANTVDYEEDLNETVNIFGESVKIVQRITAHNGICTTVTENDENYMPVRITVRNIGEPGFVTVSKYDSKRNLIASQDYRGMVTLTDYTENGQVMRTRSYHSSEFNTAAALTCPDSCFVKEYTYDKNDEFITSESDSRSTDIRTQYDYSASDGALNHTTDKNGVRTTYAYDHNTGAVTMVSSSVDGQNNSIAYGYTHRMLTAITHNGFEYLFEYDGFGRQTKIFAGGDILAENTYTLTDTTTVTTTYANNDSLTVTTDRHQSPISKTYTKADIITYEDDETEYGSEVVIPGYTETLITNEYDELGKLTESVDNCTNVVYNYRYNELGNVEEEKRNGETFKTLEYSSNNRLKKTTVHTSDETLVYMPIYETRDSDGAIYAENAIRGMMLEGVYEQSVTKDKNGRPNRTSLHIGEFDECCGFTDELLALEYGYLTSGNRLTDIVNTVTHKVNGYISDELKYKYDNNGNIIAICREGEPEVSTECGYDECGNPICTTTTTKNDVPVFEYVYDGLNRLIRENNYVLGKTYTYKYDAAGNILSKSTYDVTSGAVVTPTDVKLYNYANTGWKDKLTSYDGVGITYDSMGNPLSYRGHSLEWSRIRLLTKWDNVVMDYNANGIRTRKGDTYYEIDGDNIISETTCGDTIRYYYGSSGVVGFRYNGARYYYEKNLQGDIIAIYDESGNKVGGYAYDAWGNTVITTDAGGIATVNPFRYRGYYYDSDLGLYYLKSRYYDAVTCRFINADGYISTGQGVSGYNMFVYCGNNPVNRKDPSGQWWIKALVITAAVVVAASVVMKIVADNIIDESGANDAEKALAKKDYIAAYQVNEAKTITEEYIDKTYGMENDLDGTQVNAYRHAMWNAVMTDKIGAEKAKKFADAHEQFSNNPVEHMEMDLHNNALGRRIALEYAGQGYDVFSQKIQEAINNGEAKVIKWDSSVN